MTYRTILAYLDDSERTPTLVAVAAELARAHEARLVGLAPTGWLDIPGRPRPALAGMEYIPFTTEALLERARKVASAFEDQARGLGLGNVEARVQEGDPVPSTLMHGRTADLVVISQSDHHAPTPAVPWEFPPQVVMGCGRPVLVVPRSGEVGAVGRHVLLAWNGSREATRAVADSLPLLCKAQKVEVLCFEEAPSPGLQLQPRTADLSAWLSIHGVRAGLVHERRRGNVGAELIEHASKAGAALVVMGCYGHSRLSEFVLGGASRTMLEDMKVPVLMSH